MKFIKYINICLCLIMISFFAACSYSPSNSSNSKFVGIAIFQSSVENSKWDNIKDDESLINHLIETDDDKIVYDQDPEFLFYIYTQNEITNNTKDSDYISNTTRDKVLLDNQTLTFTFERLAEETDILIYYIYKIDDEYYLEFIKSQDNISNESETISLDIDNDYFNKIELNLKINLSVKEEY